MNKPVIFLSASGEEISNDPQWRARKFIGSDAEEAMPEDEEQGDGYDELSGKELKALAAERGVNIKGLKTTGDVREALRDADEDSDTEE